MLPGTTLWRLIAFVLWTSSQWGVAVVSADGFIAFPPEQFVKADTQVDRPRASGGGGDGLRGQQSPQLQVHAFSSDSATTKLSSKTGKSSSSKTNAKELTSASTSSLKRLIDESIPDCGKSRVDIAPVDVTQADKFQWRSANAGYSKPSKGPCEIWIDSKRAFESLDCAKIFPDELGTIKFDYSPCRGTCLLTFYWLETGNGSESKPMKHCVPICNGKHSESDSSSKSESGSKSASASGSGSGNSSSPSSGFGSRSGSNDNSSKCLVALDDLRDLGTLSKLYDAVYGSGGRRDAPASKPRVRHHELFKPFTPKWHQRPLVAVSDPYFGGFGYSAKYTKSATQQCKYAPNGDFSCSSTESITDTFQPYDGHSGDGGAYDLSDVAYQSIAGDHS